MHTLTSTVFFFKVNYFPKAKVVTVCNGLQIKYKSMNQEWNGIAHSILKKERQPHVSQGKKITQDRTTDDHKVIVILKGKCSNTKRKYIKPLTILPSVNAYYTENSDIFKAIINNDIFLHNNN